MNKEFIVTLKRKDDLEDFYAEMSSSGFKLSKKRPISRNTHYYMTTEQAEDGIRDQVSSRGLGDVYKRQRSQEVGNVKSL